MLKPTYPKTYQRYEHFCKLLDNVPSRSKIDYGVIEIIKKEIKIERVHAKELKEDIKRYFKKNKLTKYNHQISLIIRLNQLRSVN